MEEIPCECPGLIGSDDAAASGVVLDVRQGNYRIGHREGEIVRGTRRHPCVTRVDFRQLESAFHEVDDQRSSFGHEEEVSDPNPEESWAYMARREKLEGEMWNREYVASELNKKAGRR